jgi:hypothetical protein
MILPIRIFVNRQSERIPVACGGVRERVFIDKSNIIVH